MNQVSNMDLAIAVAQAGGFPSISIFNYCIGKGVFDWNHATQDLLRYKNTLGNCDLVLSIDTSLLLTEEQNPLVDLVCRHSITHVEVIAIGHHGKNQIAIKKINHWRSVLQDSGVKLILKTVVFPNDIENWGYWDNDQRHMDAIGLKGPAGAGRVMETDLTLEEMLAKCLEKFPNIPVITVGGIGTNLDVKKFLDLGAMAVSAGTIFAASTESPVSALAKQKMIESNDQSLSKINTDRLKQNALKFDDFDRPDDDNNTFGLQAGVRDGKVGHVFAGHAINSITEILPVKTIIQRLFDRA